jgi:hypothetical protein
MDRRELESAAATYAHMRGLLMLPVSALLVVSALANAEVLPVWSFPAALVPAAVACLAILRYYRTHYGRVTHASQAKDAAAIAVAVISIVACGVLLGDLPVNDIAIGFGLGMLAGSAITPGLRAHHVVVWGGLALAGAVPLWDGPDPENAGLVLAGAAVAICGLLDHRAFTDRFGPLDARA